MKQTFQNPRLEEFYYTGAVFICVRMKDGNYINSMSSLLIYMAVIKNLQYISSLSVLISAELRAFCDASSRELRTCIHYMD